MLWKGCGELCLSKRSSSTPVALPEYKEKFTPLCRIVAPKGWGEPSSTSNTETSAGAAMKGSPLESKDPPHLFLPPEALNPPSRFCCGRLVERPHGSRFIVHNVKDGIQPRKLHHIVQLFGEIDQFHFPVLLPCR